jgi:signal transduction histidine kinase
LKDISQSITFRATAAIIAIFLATLFILIIIFTHYNQKKIEDNLNRLSQLVSFSITDYLINGDYPQAETALQHTLFTYPNLYRLQVIKKGNRVVAEASREMLQSGLEELRFPIKLDPTSIDQIAELRVVHHPSFNLVGEAPRELWAVLFISSITILVVAITSYLLIHRWLLTPLIKAGEFATAVQDGDFSQKIEHTRRDEIGTLFDTLNAMLDKTRDHLQMAQRSVIGEMAVDITRDISSPITVIELQVNTLLLEYQNRNDVKLRLEKILSMGQKIRTIVQNTKIMAHCGDQDEIEQLSCKSICQKVQDIAEHKLAKSNIEFTTNIDSTIDSIKMRETHVIQLLVNLVYNSIHAVTGGQRPWIKLSINHLDNQQGVLIKVCDSGPGVPPELMDKIFNSAFTTKGSEHRTGLGLTLCQKIALQYNGRIYLDTNASCTTFVLELPVS